MVGQNVMRDDLGAATGFEIDFFEGIEDDGAHYDDGMKGTLVVEEG